jgi:hypothetical protein
MMLPWRQLLMLKETGFLVRRFKARAIAASLLSSRVREPGAIRLSKPRL